MENIFNENVDYKFDLEFCFFVVELDKFMLIEGELLVFGLLYCVKRKRL